MSKWEEKRLDDLVKVNPVTISTKDGEREIKYIDISSVSRGVLEGYTTYKIADAPSRAKREVKQGDTLFSTVRPNLRAYYYVRKCPDNAVASTGFVVLRAKKTADKRFVYYLVTENSFVNWLTLVAKGSAYPAVDSNDFKKAKVTVPDLPTQTRIADILSAYDDAIENNNRRIALLEKAAQELYKEWFVRFRFPSHENAKFVNGLPEGWKVKKVKEVLKRHPFGTLYKEPQLSPFGKTIVIDQSTKAYLGFHNNKPDHQASDESPIIIFGDHSCKMQLMIRPFSLSENVIPITSADETSEIFLYYSLLGKIGTTEYKRHWSEFVAKKILLPTMELRMSFTETVKDNISQKELLWEANQNLARQRDLLLPRLMSGKLEV